MENLNQAVIPSDTRYADQEPLKDYSVKVPASSFDDVEVVLRGLEGRLVEMIDAHKAQSIGPVFGSVAWLTSRPILQALQGVKASLIVQKEDFLRPDYIDRKRYAIDHNKVLRKLYDGIESGLYRFHMQGVVAHMSTLHGDGVHGVRCVGNHNRDKRAAMPRAHHKFLVFCQVADDVKYGKHGYIVPEYYYDERPHNRWYWPYAVWTGSFNFTHNGTRSLENAVILTSSDRDNPVLNGYMMEHHQLYAISESLDWGSEWMEPEYRIGT
jgi:hypothetical protein